MLLGLFFSAALINASTDGKLWFRILSPWLLWPASALMPGTALGRALEGWSRYSFFLFLSHSLILGLLLQLLKIVIEGQIPFHNLYWIMSVLATAIIAKLAYDVLRRLCPQFLDVLTGNRVKRTSGEKASRIEQWKNR